MKKREADDQNQINERDVIGIPISEINKAAGHLRSCGYNREYTERVVRALSRRGNVIFLDLSSSENSSLAETLKNLVNIYQDLDTIRDFRMQLKRANIKLV